MGKTYVFPDDTKALLIFEVNGEKMFISPMQQQDIRLAFEIYQSPQTAADMINLLQFRTGSEVITPAMVEAVMARPPLPHPTKPETTETQESAAVASDGHEATGASVGTEGTEQVTAAATAEPEKPEEPEIPAAAAEAQSAPAESGEAAARPADDRENGTPEPGKES